eukprot:6418524-Prymnesium_polylepis.1
MAHHGGGGRTMLTGWLHDHMVTGWHRDHMITGWHSAHMVTGWHHGHTITVFAEFGGCASSQRRFESRQRTWVKRVRWMPGV